MVDNDAVILGDPATAVDADSSSAGLAPETSVSGDIRAPNTALHRQNTGRQMPPGLSQQLPVGVPEPAIAHGSRDKLPPNNHREASSARPQPSLGSNIFSTLDANMQEAHMIPRSLPESDPANPSTPMVNQVKILLNAAQNQIARANNPRNSRPPVGTVRAQVATDENALE